VVNEQEVDGWCNYNEFTSNRGRGCTNYRRRVIDVELSSTRNIHVSTGLISTRIEIEGDHQYTLIFRSSDISTSKSIRSVIVEEPSRKIIVEIDTMSWDSDSIKSGSLNLTSTLRLIEGEDDGLGDRRRSGSSVNSGRSIISYEIRHVELSGSSLGELMPVSQTGLLRSESHTDEESLNGPLESIEKEFLTGRGSADVLISVNSDKSKSDSLDIDLMNLRIHEDVVDVEIHLRDIRGAQWGIGIKTRSSELISNQLASRC
jgi:hypothetical protein